MEAVQKAVSDAVQAVRNSPLLRRRFGRNERSGSDPSSSSSPDRSISPEKDRTPFVQGFYYCGEYLGKSMVLADQAQDHGCTDEAVTLLWSDSPDVGKPVKLRVTTTNIRIKLTNSSNTLVHDFPVFKVSYCGTDKKHKEAVTIVAKESDNVFYCYVFKMASKEKAFALALSITKAFYLACQILQEEQGLFPATPERDTLFEPQHDDDTKVSPPRPRIVKAMPPHLKAYKLSTSESPDAFVPEDHNEVDVGGSNFHSPELKLTRPSISSDHSSASSGFDDDFFRLAKARSNPDILRSTLDIDLITNPSLDILRRHADPGSSVATPIDTPTGSLENLLDTKSQ